MIDPLSPLYQSHQHVAGSILPNAADPVASQGLLIVGVAIIIATAFWAVGGLVAAVWTRLADFRDRRLHFGSRGARRAGPA